MSELESKNTAKEQLLILRDLFRMSGALHEAQKVQLQLWPRVFIENSISAETFIKFTPELPNAPRTVTVKVKTVGPNKKDLAKNLVRFDQCIKFLLGTDFDVTVEYGGKKFISHGHKNSDGASSRKAPRIPGLNSARNPRAS